MFIKDVCKECKLTKKAVEYYEQQGLISPAVEDNGYRNYSNEDIFVLKEIGVLRKLGISIADIRNILESTNKAAALAKCKYKMDLEVENPYSAYPVIPENEFGSQGMFNLPIIQ
jgi:DNA-binding transcriptional MerR regulator